MFEQLMATEAASAEHERVSVLAVEGQVLDTAHGDPVVPGEVLLLEHAVEMGDGAGDEW